MLHEDFFSHDRPTLLLYLDMENTFDEFETLKLGLGAELHKVIPFFLFVYCV